MSIYPSGTMLCVALSVICNPCNLCLYVGNASEDVRIEFALDPMAHPVPVYELC